MTTNAPPPTPPRERFPTGQGPATARWLPVARRFRPLLLFILVTGTISLFYPDFFRALLFEPVLGLVQILYLVYRGIPQNLTWAIFIIAAIFLAIPAIIPAPAGPEPEEEEQRIESRLADLAKLETDARTSQHARWELARSIQHVAVQLLSTEPDDTAETIHRRLQSSEIDLPSVIDELFTVCASLPSYRAFLEAREAASGGKIPALAALDLDAAVATLDDWRRPERTPF